MHHQLPVLPYGGKNCWRPHTAANVLGCGRPGGIARSRPGGSDNKNIIDLTEQINEAPNEVSSVLNYYWPQAQDTNSILLLPEGEFNRNGAINGGSRSLYAGGVIVRGAGLGRTILKGGGQFQMGIGDTKPRHLVISGPLAQGDTSCTVDGDISDFGNPFNPASPTMMKLIWQDMEDDALIASGVAPAFNTEKVAPIRSQTVHIDAIIGNTLYFWPPVMHSPHPSLAVWASGLPWGSSFDYMGVEDLTIDEQANAPFLSVAMEACMFPHLYNVEIKSTGNYHVFCSGVVRGEIRGCIFRQGAGGLASNHAGLLTGTSTGLLVEDNIWEPQFPCLEINSTSFSVFSYNRVLGTFNHNHGPHNSFNLVVGNAIDNYLTDCYFGTDERLILARNWIRNGASLRQHSYYHAFLGNLIGKVGDVGNPFWTWEQSQGLTGFFGLWFGTCEPFAGIFSRNWKQQCQLITRESDTVGVFRGLGTFRMCEGSFKVLLVSVDGTFSAYSPNGGIYLVPPTETEGHGITLSEYFRWTSSGAVLPPEGTIFNVVGPGAINFPEHNLSVPRSAYVKGNIPLATGETGLPAANPIDETNDTIEEYLDETIPAGDGVDRPDWAGFAWYGNGKGSINRANPPSVSLATFIPASAAMENGDWGRFNLATNRVERPIFTQPSGTYSEPINVIISSNTPDVTIYYTLDGTTPTTASLLYTSGITISSSLTLKAIAVKAGMDDSAVHTGMYTITPIVQPSTGRKGKTLVARRR